MHQITDKIMMIRPASFQYNAETAVNNAFQSNINEESRPIHTKAIAEFNNMVAILRSKGVTVEVFQDTEDPIKPDAIFPNNWISFHANGTVITYPMYAENRRMERQEAIIDKLGRKYNITKRYTFESSEDENKFLEGTGSMLLDRENDIVYACLSPRTNIEILEKYAVLMEVEKIAFQSVDRYGKQIYHTNVMMALGIDFVVICLASIQNETERKLVISTLEKTNKYVIDISYDQLEAFVGNMLQVITINGETLLVMSQSAFNSLKEQQINELNARTTILPIPLETIETVGGGSVRCMMAEVFLTLNDT
ncbi:MAG: arginine deiminase-related protein [Saprospiraceae bacterium]